MCISVFLCIYCTTYFVYVILVHVASAIVREFFHQQKRFDIGWLQCYLHSNVSKYKRQEPGILYNSTISYEHTSAVSGFYSNPENPT